MDYLAQIGQTFYARIPVPKDLQLYFQIKEFKQTLGTKNRTEAKRLLVQLLSKIQQLFMQWRFLQKMKPPSLQAIAIYKLRHPNRYPLTAAGPEESSLNESGWRPVDEVLLIQTHLDLGFVADEHGMFDPYGAYPVPSKHQPTIQHTEKQNAVQVAVLPDTSISLESMIDEYLEQDIHVTDSTLRNKRNVLKHLATFSKGRKAHEKLTSDSLDIFLNQYLVEKGLEFGTRKTQFGVLKAFLAYCKKKKYIDRDIYEDVRDIKLVVTQADKALQEDTANESYEHSTIQALLDSFVDKPAVNSTASVGKKLTHIRMIYYFLVAMFTGFRSQTLGQLTKNSFDFSSEVHTLAVKNILIEENGRVKNLNKTAKSLKLPIVKQLEKLHFKEFVNLTAHKGKIFNVTATLDQRLDAQLESIDLKKSKQRIHAVRGTVNNLYVIADDISYELKEMLMGHTVQETSAAYTDAKTLIRDYPDKVQGKMDRALVYKIDFNKLSNYLKEQLSFFG